MFRKRRWEVLLLAAVAVGAVAWIAVVRFTGDSESRIAGREQEVSRVGATAVPDSERPVDTPNPSIGVDQVVRAEPADLGGVEVVDRVNTPLAVDSPIAGSSLPTAHIADLIQPDLVNLSPSDLLI
jgi:hypothetical protein